MSAGGRIIMGNGDFVWVTTDPGPGIEAGFCN